MTVLGGPTRLTRGTWVRIGVGGAAHEGSRRDAQPRHWANVSEETGRTAGVLVTSHERTWCPEMSRLTADRLIDAVREDSDQTGIVVHAVYLPAGLEAD